MPGQNGENLFRGPEQIIGWLIGSSPPAWV